jgi:hypothetical protein
MNAAPLLADELEVIADANRDRVALYRQIAEDPHVCDRDRELADLLADFRSARARFWASEAAKADDQERETLERMEAAGELDSEGLYVVDEDPGGEDPLAAARGVAHGLIASLVFWALFAGLAAWLIYVVIGS